jgi:hypothetical protein
LDPDHSKHPFERAFLLKLDIIMLTLMSLGYIIKTIDDSNINNAFVSGMKEGEFSNGVFGPPSDPES